MSCIPCMALTMCECTACIACACCQKALNGVLAGAARIGHVLVIATIFALAGILGSEYPNSVNGYEAYTTVNLTEGCASGMENTCTYRQLMYRASFALFIVFVLLAVGNIYSEYLNRSYWPLKFGVATTLFVSFWWANNGFFDGWAEFCRAMAFIWLLFQGLLLVDFAHDCHDAIIAKADEDDKEEEGGGRKWLVLYIILSLGFLALACLGLTYLFWDYTGCSLGMFFVVVTIIFGAVYMIISLLNVVNKGFLTPCIMFAYSVFMCWYALLSSPESSCNPTAFDNNGYQWRVSIVSLCTVSFIILLYCVVNGSVILNIFSVDGEGVLTSYQGAKPSSSLNSKLKPVAAEGGQGLNTTESENRTSNAEITSGEGADSRNSGDVEEESGTVDERVFFHVLMVLFVIYMAMMLTNWGKTNGNVPGAGSPDVSNESMWFKILSQWAVLGMYGRILQLAYLENTD